MFHPDFFRFFGAVCLGTTTLDKRLVRKSLGRVHETDRAALKAAVQVILG
jgi:hypothetical protein